MEPTQVTLAVLPLDNLDGSPDLARMAMGFVYDLLAELARFPTLGVIGWDAV